MPEEKITHSHLACSAYEEIGVGHAGCVEAGCQKGLIDLIRLDAVLARIAGKFFCRIHDLTAATVVDREAQSHSLVGLAGRNGAIDGVECGGGQTVAVANHR